MFMEDPGGPPPTNTGGNAGNAIATAVGIIGSLVNDHFNRKTARENTDKTIQAQKDMAEYAYSKDLEMWNRQNDYNSAASQMSRLKEAGLNPNLIYGSGSGGAAGSAGPMARYNAPTLQYNYRPAQLPDMLSMYQGFQMRQAQIDNVKAQTQLTEERVMSEALNQPIKATKGQRDAYELQRRKYFEQTDLEALNARVEKDRQSQSKMLTEMYNMDERRKLMLLESKYKQAQMDSMAVDREKKISETIFNQYRNEWMKMGITTSDNVFLRLITRMVGESGLDVGGFLNSVQDFGEEKYNDARGRGAQTKY